MIDYEVKIFNRVHASVASLCSGNRFVSTPIADYTKIPAASLYEMDNRTVRDRQSSTPTENFSRITYQFEAIAPTKSKCRELAIAADSAMNAMNFTRISGQYVPYPDHMKVSRWVARYEAEVDQDGNLYRR